MTLLKASPIRRGLLLAVMVLVAAPVSAVAQSRGFDYVARAIATAEDRRRQPDLWVLEVHYKTLRMIPVEITDPATGEKQLERVWYLPYKVVNRPLARLDEEEDVEPVNEFDPPPTPPIFVPELTLVATDNDEQRIYEDVVLPEAQAAINRRERREFLNSVQLAGDIPRLTREAEGEETAVYGVATWRGVDPDTDYFRVIFSGFSNGYHTETGPDGNTVVMRKTLVQKYWRPGDRFDEYEKEARVDGDPQWVDRPDDSNLDPAVLPQAGASR